MFSINGNLISYEVSNFKSKFTGMKLLIYILILLIPQSNFAQSNKELVSKACLNYIEGFYEGDTIKLKESLKPSLHKFGFWKDKVSGKYLPDGYMTFQQAIDYAIKVAANKKFAKPGSPKKVEILDIQNCIASAKVTAWWGVDYILLSRQENKWMIEQVLWEGPLQN